MLSINRFSQFIIVLKKSDIFSFQAEKFEIFDLHTFPAHKKRKKKERKKTKGKKINLDHTRN